LTGRQIVRLTGRQIVRLTGRQIVRLTGRQIVRLTGRQIVRLPGRQIVRLTGISEDRHKYILSDIREDCEFFYLLISHRESVFSYICTIHEFMVIWLLIIPKPY
jgi:hypothetical protein